MHRLHLPKTLALVLGLAATVAHAEREIGCPTNVYYANGSYLKAGDNFYYANGSYLKAGGNLYFDNGSYLKAGENLYYPNGSYLKAGTNLYYPNGGYLKAGTNLYYPNGSYLRAGQNFYYENGSYARAGSTLYRTDGSTTAFPISLSANIGTVGSFRADVGSDYEAMSLAFESLLAGSGIVSSRLDTDSQLEVTNVRVVVNSGRPNENVVLNVGIDGSYTCALTGATQPIDFKSEM